MLEGGQRNGEGSRRILARFRLEDDALAGAAVHDHADGIVEVKMTHAAVLAQRSLAAQPVPIDGAFAGVWIHGEVTDLKGSEILEEMAALRWGDAEIAESGLNNHARAGDF